MRRGPIRWSDDSGQVAGIEAIPFGLLTFVIGALLVANAWAVIDAKMAVTTAAREGARVYVEANDAHSGASAAHNAASDALGGYGRDADRATISIRHEGDAGYERCVRVYVQVDYPIPAVSLPWIGGFGEGFTASATHTEVIDPFRDDLGGTASCP